MPSMKLERKLKTRLTSKRFVPDGVCMDSIVCPNEQCIKISNSINKEQGKFAWIVSKNYQIVELPLVTVIELNQISPEAHLWWFLFSDD